MEMLAFQAGSCITSSRLFERVQKDRRWISSVVDSMVDGIVVTDRRGRIVLANETARELFCLDEEHRPPPGNLSLTLLMEEVAQLPDGETFDYVVLKPRPEMLSVRTTVLKDRDGETTAIILGMRNVKELKEIERKNLEFLSLVSHELENHFRELEGQLPAHMERGAAEVMDLISNLVFYSEIESGPMRLERRVEDPYELIRAAAADLARQFESKGIEFELSEGKSTSVLVDPERIVGLVKGILRYVISGTEKGCKVLVQVEPSEQVRGEVHVHFDINGLELSEKDIVDLFDKTYQVENYISIIGRQTTGLGFVFLRHIAEAHGGSFSAVPLDNGALRFSVTVRR
jgi:signal transduction histidine kinase